MRKPYTYLIKHKSTSKLYYGLRYAKNCKPSDLWESYFTSSSDVKQLVEQYGADDFEVQIRRVFDCPYKAIEWEKKVLRRMKVIGRDDFINRNIPGSSMFKHSEETKMKMRKPKSDEFRQKARLRKQSEATRQKISESRKGMKFSEEHKQALSAARRNRKTQPRQGINHSEKSRKKIADTLKKKKWMNNGEYSAFVSPENFEQYLSRGYIFGRGSTTYRKEPKNGI